MITGATQLPPQMWGAMAKTESKMIIMNNELLTGLIDKKHIAAQPNSLIHFINELIGGEAAGIFLSSYGRVTTLMLQKRGLTCNLEDMILMSHADQERDEIASNMDKKFERIV